MKMLVAASALIVAAGCAHQAPTQVAQAECKIVPLTTASIAGGKPRNVHPLDQRHAEMQLGTSQYRMAQLQSQGMAFNNIEDALRDCNR